jgi:hypothetical protein
LKDPTLFQGSDPVRLAVQAAAYAGQQLTGGGGEMVHALPVNTPGFAGQPASPGTSIPFEQAYRLINKPFLAQSQGDVNTYISKVNQDLAAGGVPELSVSHPDWEAAFRTYWPQVQRQQYLDSLPDLNKLVGRNFLRLDPDSRDFMLSGYEAKSYSEPQVLNSVLKQLPGAFAFKGAGPTPFGTVKR